MISPEERGAIVANWREALKLPTEEEYVEIADVATLVDLIEALDAALREAREIVVDLLDILEDVHAEEGLGAVAHTALIVGRAKTAGWS